MDKLIVVAVNDGESGSRMSFMGPFDTRDEAYREAEAWATDHDAWWIATLTPPFDAEIDVAGQVAAFVAPAHQPDWED